MSRLLRGLRSNLATTRRQLSSAAALTDAERYLFDLNGFVVVRNLLTKEEVDAANQAIDRRIDEFVERPVDIKNARHTDFSSSSNVSSGRLEHGHFLEWPKEDSQPFRSLLAHRGLVPRVQSFVGEGFRLDHLPLLLIQRPQVEGFDRHGGAIASNGEWNQELSYTFQSGRSRCSLLAVSVALSDVEEDDGGFVIVPGSHKANLPPPTSVLKNECGEDILRQPKLKAGDAIIFSEATMHGALPWKGTVERRFALYRYGPGHHGYGRGYLDGWSEEMVSQLTEEERTVLLPPFGNRLDRQTLRFGEQGEAVAKVHSPRHPDKKAFDQQIFLKHYF